MIVCTSTQTQKRVENKCSVNTTLDQSVFRSSSSFFAALDRRSLHRSRARAEQECSVLDTEIALHGSLVRICFEKKITNIRLV